LGRLRLPKLSLPRGRLCRRWRGRKEGVARGCARSRSRLCACPVAPAL